MTLRTALVIDGDASGGVRALEQTDAAMAGSQAEAEKLAAAYAKSDAAIAQLAQAQTQAAAAIAKTKTAFDAGEIGLEEYNRGLLEVKSALSLVAAEHNAAIGSLKTASSAYRAANDNLDGVGKTSKLAGYQVQNLTYQLNDMVVGLASGQAPLTVLIQQGSQIAPIMASAGIGIGGLVKQVALMAGGFLLANPLLLAAGAVAGVAAAGLGFMTAEIDKTTKAHVTFQDVALGVYDVVRDYLTNTLTKAFAFFGTSTGDVWATVVEYARKATNLLIGIVTIAPRALITAFQVIPAALGDIFYSGTNLAIGAINGLVEKAVTIINGFAVTVNPILEKVGLSIPTLLAPRIATLTNSYAGAAAAAGKAFVGNLTDTVNRDFIKEGVALFGAAATKRAIAREAEDAGKKAGEALGKGASIAAAKAGKDAGKAFVDNFADVARDIAAANKVLERNKALEDTLAGLQREAQLIGIVGAERERLRVTLENQAAIQKVLNELEVARQAGYVRVVEGLQNQLALLGQINDQRLKNIDAEAATKGGDDPAKQARDLADALDTTAQRAANAAQVMRDAFGSVGGTIGSLAANLADYQSAQAKIAEDVARGTVTQAHPSRP